MSVLAKEPLYGYVIVQRLSVMTMFEVQRPDITGVYRLLKSMEKKGFLTSTWESATHGPAKRRYALTPGGRTCLARWITTLHNYRDAVDNLLESATAGIRVKRKSR